MNNCNTQVGIQTVDNLPIDNLESVVDYFLAIREITDTMTGEKISTFTKLPGQRVTPDGTLANLFSLEHNNSALAVEEGQPLPAYVRNEGNRLVVLPADAGHKAMFLVVRIDGDYAICTNSSIIHTLGGNKYIAGAKYYLASDGSVTTDPSQTGQPLFVCLGKTKLLVNLGA